MDTESLVRETTPRIAETADADREIIDGGYMKKATTLPPLLQGLGIDQKRIAEDAGRIAVIDTRQTFRGSACRRCLSTRSSWRVCDAAACRKTIAKKS